MRNATETSSIFIYVLKNQMSKHFLSNSENNPNKRSKVHNEHLQNFHKKNSKQTDTPIMDTVCKFLRLHVIHHIRHKY